MAFNIIGGNGEVLSAAEAAADMMVGAAEAGAMDPYHVIGAISPNLASLRNAPTLQPRLLNLSQRFAPNLAAALRGAMGPAVANQPPPNPAQMREVVQGLDTGPVPLAPGASTTLTFNATMTFRPSRLMVGPAFAPLFTIDDVKVAADSLFLSPGSVPAEVFLPNAVTASAIKRRTAQAGTPLFITLTNVDVAAHRFRGAIFGEALDQGSC